jgi:hypothetical protein
MLDAEKKKEKKKNIARHALEQRWAQARCEGKPEEDSPDEDAEEDDDDDDDDVEGMGAHLDRLLQLPPRAGVSSMQEESSKEPQSGEHGGCP